MFILYVIVYLFVILTKFSIPAVNYCSLSPEHVLCSKKGYSARCGDVNKTLLKRVNDKERMEILNAHNWFRNNISDGMIRDGYNLSFPKAANMEELVWDNELTAIAESFLKGCSLNDSCRKCLKTERFNELGNNLFIKAATKKSKPSSCPNVTVCEMEVLQTWKAIIDIWTLKELRLYDAKEIDNFTLKRNSLRYSQLGYGQLTQVIWAKTRRIGCARIKFEHPKNKVPTAIAQCLYGPSGNVPGEEVYIKGLPCSSCAGNNSKCVAPFKNLCSKGSRIDEPIPPEYTDKKKGGKKNPGSTGISLHERFQFGSILITIGSVLHCIHISSIWSFWLL